MTTPTKDEQRRLVQVWEQAGEDLERMRCEQLRNLPYRWQDVDALLELGDYYKGPARETSGLVEMQKWFMEFARRQGLLAPAVGEPPGEYKAGKDA